MQLDLLSNLQSGAPVAVPGLSDAIHISTVTLSSAVDGRPRLNIENRDFLAQSGLKAGASFRPEFGADFIFLRHQKRAAWDSMTVSPKVYANRDGSTTTGSRVDLRRAQIADVFGNEATLLVAYCSEGVLITLLPTRKAARRRWEQLTRAAQRGELTTGSLYSGIGTLDAAAHAGLEEAGFTATSLFANDFWELALEAMRADNPARPVRALACGVEQVVTMADEIALAAPEILIMGVPCKGASRLNIQHREAPELHPIVGHQVLNVAMFLRALKFAPSIILIENVTAWADTVSCAMLTRVLEEQGYAVKLVGDRDGDTYRGLNGADFGDMERRRRMALLAYPPELEPHLDFSIMRRRKSSTTIADIRLAEGSISPGEYEKGLHLDAKSIATAGTRNSRQNRIVNDSDTTTPSLSSECYKMRVEDPKFRHPNDPTKWRLPKPEEHARLKGQPEALIRSLSADTLAHVALGNGTTRKVWLEFFRALGLSLRAATLAPTLA